MTNYFLAIDIGASSGRHILGYVKNGKILLDEVKEDKMGEVSLAGRAADPVRLGEKEYFLLGDNRGSSEDSRFPNIGNVKREQILGKAWFRMLPLLNLGFVS